MDVSVIIVNYNVKDLVDNCIASIYKANPGNKLNIEIFFVDNNSVDGSVEHIKNKYPGVITIALEKNVGFSKANNAALREATGKYILILNPDTLLEEGTFPKLIEFVKAHPDAGAVTSKLILATGKLDSACKRSFPTPAVAIPRILGLSKLFPKSKTFGKYNLTYLDENKTYRVDAICGAFMFIPKPVLDKVGYFDEDYFMYGEDLDLCYRINKAGYKIYYYPEVTTIHFKGESTRKTHLSYVNNFYGAMNIFVKKNFTGTSRVLSLILQTGIYYRSAFSYFKRIFFILLYPLIDIILLYTSLILSVKFRFNIFPNKEYLFIITVYVLLWTFLLAIFGLYTKRNYLSLKRVFNAVIAGFFVNSSITYFFKEYAFSREVILTSTVISLCFLALWRGAFRLYQFFQAKNILLNRINLLIVGRKELNENIEDRLTSKYNILYFNDIAPRKTVSELKEVILINNIKEVVFSDEHFSNQDILNTMWSLKSNNVNFKIIPTGKDLILSKLKSNIDELSFIEIEYNINNKMNIFLKRVFDIFLSFLLLITVYPILLLLKYLLKVEFSRQASKLFLLPRVFIGELSLVGIPVWFEKDGKEYLGKRGLTGLIQLNYYEGITPEDMSNYNIYYAKNQSLSFDMEILLKTIFSFFKK